MRSNTALALHEQQGLHTIIAVDLINHSRLSVSCLAIDRPKSEIRNAWATLVYLQVRCTMTGIRYASVLPGVLHLGKLVRGLHANWRKNNREPQARWSPNQDAAADVRLPGSSDLWRPDIPSFEAGASSPIAKGLLRARQSNLSAASRYAVRRLWRSRSASITALKSSRVLMARWSHSIVKQPLRISEVATLSRSVASGLIDATSAWKPRSRTAGTQSRPRAGSAGGAQRPSLDRAPVVRKRLAMRSWPGLSSTCGPMRKTAISTRRVVGLVGEV
jgi:hypothetical protein